MNHSDHAAVGSGREDHGTLAMDDHRGAEGPPVVPSPADQRMSPSGPVLFESQDQDEVNQFISDTYIGAHSRLGKVRRHASFQALTIVKPEIYGGLIRSSIDYGGTSDPFDHQLFYVCVNGQIRVDGITGEQRLRAGDASFFAMGKHTTMNRRHHPRPGHVQPAALRRAVDYIDTHAHEPISVTDIATAAGTTSRALQYAFRRHRGTTPLDLLRQVRLARAHQELQHADPGRGDTVAAIATRWGFTSPGHFATIYRRTYGQPPSRTLRC